MKTALLRLVPKLFVEWIARLAGYAVGVLRPNLALAAERRVRGAYFAFCFGAKRLQVGRSVQLESPTRMSIGDRVTLFCSSHYISGSSGFVAIGNGTHIGRFCVFSGLGTISVGQNCAISSNVSVYTVTNDANAACPATADNIKAPVTIEDCVLIGAGVSILPGVTIGESAVIGAGSVVVTDIPANAIAAGVPARVLRFKDTT